MASGLINITIKVSGSYNDVLHVTTYPASDPLNQDGSIDVNPPYDNPQNISIVVPTTEAHFVKILDVNNNLVSYNVINYKNGSTEQPTINVVSYGFKVGDGNSYGGVNTFTLDTDPYDFKGKTIVSFIKGGTPLTENFSFNFDKNTGKFDLIGDQWNNGEIGSIVGL